MIHQSLFLIRIFEKIVRIIFGSYLECIKILNSEPGTLQPEEFCFFLGMLNPFLLLLRFRECVILEGGFQFGQALLSLPVLRDQVAVVVLQSHLCLGRLVQCVITEANGILSCRHIHLACLSIAAFFFPPRPNPSPALQCCCPEGVCLTNRHHSRAVVTGSHPPTQGHTVSGRGATFTHKFVCGGENYLQGDLYCSLSSPKNTPQRNFSRK